MSDTVNNPDPSVTVRTDPRPGLDQAILVAATVLAGVRPDQFNAPTPCTDYTVRDLCNHLVAMLRRAAAVAGGGDPFSIPTLAEDVADGGWSAAWAAAKTDLDHVVASPAVLNRIVRMPFGQVPGAVALATYTTEFTLHTWDLATATGQDPAWNPAVLAASIAAMGRVPATPRGDQVPFAAVVPVAESAPDIDRLVAWYGRRP